VTWSGGSRYTQLLAVLGKKNVVAFERRHSIALCGELALEEALQCLDIIVCGLQ
jgi:uncharacterized protein YunC (DUF1805 family)